VTRRNLCLSFKLAWPVADDDVVVHRNTKRLGRVGDLLGLARDGVGSPEG